MAQDTVSVVVEADSRSVRSATGDLNKFSASGTKSKSAMRALLPALTAVLSVRAFAGMAKDASDFGSALAEVSTLMGDFSEMPRIEQEAKNLAAAFGGTATIQAEAFYSAISAGAATAEDATKLLTVANQLAIGGATDLQSAVTGLSGIMNAFGVAAENAGDVSDALFVAMKAGQTTVGELTNSVGKVSAIASSAGVSFEEMLAATAALTTQGIATSEAVTGLKAALTNILKPSKDASELAEELGLQFNYAGLESKGLTGFMADLIEKTGGSEEAVIKLFGSVEAMNAVFALTGKGADKFNEIIADMADKAGQTETAFEKMAGTIEQRMAVVKGSLSNTKIEVGNLFIALSLPLLDVLEDNIGAWNEAIVDLTNNIYNFVQTEQFGMWVEGITVGIETLTVLLVTRFVVVLGASFVTTIMAASGAMGMLGAAVAFLGGPVTLAIAAITGLSIAVALLMEAPIAGYLEELEAAAEKGIGPLEDHIVSLHEKIAGLQLAMDLRDPTQTFGLQGMVNELEGAKSALDVAQAKLDTMSASLENEVQPSIEETAQEFNSLNEVTGLSALALANLISAEEDTAEETVALTGTIATLNNTVGILKDQNVNPLGLDLYSLATTIKDDTAPAFRVVTEEMEKTSKELVVHAAAVENAKVKQQIMNNMLENVQSSFGDLFFDLIDGKSSFKDFFNSVVDGFKRMIAELAAQSLMNAIFGGGGLSGFLGDLKAGMAKVWATISGGSGSASTSAVTSAASSAGGSVAASSAAGGTAGTAATGGGIGAAISTGVTAIGQFVGGMTGTAVGTGAAIAGPPTAAAAAGAGLSGSIAAGASNLWAFMTNPITMAIVAIALAAKLLDPSGTMSHNAGMLTGDFETDPSRKFDIDPFASGAQFYGMNRRASVDQAQGVVAGFRAIDASLTEGARSAGLTVNLSASDFIGTDEKGKGTGAFFGSAFEEGGSKGKSLEDQYTTFTKRWLTLVAGDNGTDPAVLNNLLSLGSSQEILAAIDGSHASGIDRVPYDNYIAQLHEGERVQSVQEAQRTDLMAAEMFNLRGNLNDLMLVVAKAVNKTARIESRWDVNGLPPTRS